MLGAGTLWLSYDRDWHWLWWGPAVVADVIIGVALVLGRRGAPHECDLVVKGLR